MAIAGGILFWVWHGGGMRYEEVAVDVLGFVVEVGGCGGMRVGQWGVFGGFKVVCLGGGYWLSRVTRELPSKVLSDAQAIHSTVSRVKRAERSEPWNTKEGREERPDQTERLRATGEERLARSDRQHPY